MAYTSTDGEGTTGGFS